MSVFMMPPQGVYSKEQCDNGPIYESTNTDLLPDNSFIFHTFLKCLCKWINTFTQLLKNALWT